MLARLPLLTKWASDVEAYASSRLRVELLPDTRVTLGMVVSVLSTEGTIFYQVLDAETSEEDFGTLKYGSHIAFAFSIGTLDSKSHFARVDAVPMIGAAVFGVSNQLAKIAVGEQAFVLGDIAGTSVELTGDFVEHLETHTAILGTTGSGKTEFAFDLLRYSLGQGVKVICIDLTSQYSSRLSDLSPSQLTINDAKAKELGTKLFEVETGTYGAGPQKQILQEFAVGVRDEIQASLGDFLSNPERRLGLIELKEISNTKATLLITEMYLSTLLNIAKENPLNDKVLVVVEEAHTVMPEASFLGLGDYDSRATVSKITQLALQGRKYGVGLLVLAQRTATVIKSVLTQCNTVISFSCIDDTSIGFLRNVYGSAIAESLPNLQKLRAVAHGPWINSEVPVLFDVPFNKEKADKKLWSDHRTQNLSSQMNPQKSNLSTFSDTEPSDDAASPPF